MSHAPSIVILSDKREAEATADDLKTHLSSLRREYAAQGMKVVIFNVEDQDVAWGPGDVLLLLVTPRFMRDDVAARWAPLVEEALKNGDTCVPVRVAPCVVTRECPLLPLQALPEGWSRDGDPCDTKYGWISQAADRDGALMRVAAEVRAIVEGSVAHGARPVAAPVASWPFVNDGVYHTSGSSYHVRGGVCVKVACRRSGVVKSDHDAIGLHVAYGVLGGSSVDAAALRRGVQIVFGREDGQGMVTTEIEGVEPLAASTVRVRPDVAVFAVGEDAGSARELDAHLDALRRAGVSVWTSWGSVRAGDDWRQVHAFGESAAVKVLLVSASFVGDERSWELSRRLIGQPGTMVVVLSDFYGSDHAFGGCPTLPEAGGRVTPVASFRDRSTAWSQVVGAIHASVRYYR